jgi:hypothetical protein
VRALQGFTRVAPEKRFVPVDTSTSRRARWLPAVEVFGEGIFLSLDEDPLTEWEQKEQVKTRVAGLTRDIEQSFQRDRLTASTGDPMLPRFPLLHTFAHLLIRQLAYESGYSTASLRERVYARPHQDGDPSGAQHGVLIYTGTLSEILIRLLEQAAWCSADPLCAEHTGQGYANLNRAACHACTLLPETSCETGNALLDRMLVVGGAGVPGFFESVIEQAQNEAMNVSGEYRIK